MASTLVFYVNGKKVSDPDADPEMTLLYYLRNKLGLRGSKLGCAEGGCGACTVMVSKYERAHSNIRHYTVNACLAPVCSMHGLAVTTVEGIGSIKTGLHPVQERIAKSHGSQCGFCTPGIVMSMYTLMRNNPQPSRADMESAFEGNLCRCTGYRPILDGFKTFTKEFQCGMGDQCCMTGGQSGCGSGGPSNGLSNGASGSENASMQLVNPSEFLPYDPTQEPIFPSELQLTDEYDSETVVFQGSNVAWHRPTSLDQLLQLKAQHPQARLVIGNTEVGVEVKFKNMKYPVLVAPTHVPELNTVHKCESGVWFGASTCLSQVEDVLDELIKDKPEHETRVYVAIVEMLRWFAGHQIRNVAAIAGNIMTASPISDLNPLFLAAGCTLEVASAAGGRRKIPMDGQFFLGYRKTAVKPDEVMVAIHIPFTKEDEYFSGYKQAHRREDDIAIVNAGLRVLFEPGTNIIKDMGMAFGGMAPITVLAAKTMKELVGRRWDDDLVSSTCELLGVEMPLPAGTPGGMEPYRRTLTTSFFFKFYLAVKMQLHQRLPKLYASPVPDNYNCATSVYAREPSRGIQVCEEADPLHPGDSVGQPTPHLSGLKQATGEAVYCDDMPPYKDELYLSLVLSTKAHAKVLNVDATEALSMPGVVDFVTHKDVPGLNATGVAHQDEHVFVSDMVTAPGVAMGAIVADNQMNAQRAAKAVKVTYEELKPIITIEEAIEAKSFFAEIKLENGNVDQGLAEADHIVIGEARVGGQDHFYLETQATVAVPKGEDGEMEVFSSCQNPSKAQLQVASALGVPANRINVRVKRIGGGFGGKETRYVVPLLQVAVAANKHQKPVRCMLDRDEDMVVSGTRHPFLGKYKIGFTKEGVIKAVELDIYSNAGYSTDLSHGVMERAVFHQDNCYLCPNVRVRGYQCKTNLPSNTAFRGFGAPQSMFICESWITAVAAKLGMSPEQVREINLYKEGDKTPFNTTLINCNIRRCWEEVIQKSNFYERRKEVEKFNSQNRWKKRGITVVNTKFGISFTAFHLNQSGALVHVYTDGSVLVTHGGTEMGQGLHTKMIQVASRALNIPMSKIHISETSTNTVPNTPPTAASASTDLNGMAVLIACETIMKNLQPFKDKNPTGSWEDWVKAAYFDRVALSATGFYRTPDLGYNWKKNEGNPFNYFVFGAACSEVEIDCLTGDHTVLRTDIVMDLGKSLNPAIDIGQIEGAFVQGYGMFTLEEQRYSTKGFLYTRGPGAYKIPGFGDIPIEFNVSLLKGASNPKAVYSSKAVGEPPLFLASSVFFAIKEALLAARQESGIQGDFRLDSPATAESIRMACVDQFTKQFPPGEPGTFTPWFVHA